MYTVKRFWNPGRDKTTGIKSLICRIFGHRLINQGRLNITRGIVFVAVKRLAYERQTEKNTVLSMR
jgi:hypothetical protein